MLFPTTDRKIYLEKNVENLYRPNWRTNGGRRCQAAQRFTVNMMAVGLIPTCIMSYFNFLALIIKKVTQHKISRKFDGLDWSVSTLGSLYLACYMRDNA